MTSINRLKLAPSLACSRFVHCQLPEIGSPVFCVSACFAFQPAFNFWLKQRAATPVLPRRAQATPAARRLSAQNASRLARPDTGSMSLTQCAPARRCWAQCLVTALTSRQPESNTRASLSMDIICVP
nr:hypothetical protein [uncultured bacterium]